MHPSQASWVGLSHPSQASGVGLGHLHRSKRQGKGSATVQKTNQGLEHPLIPQPKGGAQPPSKVQGLGRSHQRWF